MRSALGRLLGVILTLALVSVLALSALARLAETLGPRVNTERLPLFFNARPSNVHDRAERALAAIARGKHVAEAQAELARLGGAALPHVLPKLDELRPAARGNVAIALAPVAERMELARAEELGTSESAIAFWGRFWQDHAFDFRPQVVRRLVERLASRSSALARDDIVRLDTYAVPDLVAALGRIRTAEDVQRARRVTLLLAHVTGRGPVVERGASIAEARTSARAWRRFFVEQGADFTTLDGPRRVVAMFAQTQYGRWLGRLFGVIRVGQERQPALGVDAEEVLFSAVRYVSALAGGLLLALLWARLEFRGTVAGRVLRGLAATAVAVPAPFVVSELASPSSNFARGLLAVALTALFGGALLSRTQLSVLADTRFWENVPRGAVLGGTLRALPSSLPWLTTTLLGLEVLLDVPGVARASIHGLWQGDITPGMSLALGGALGAATISALADGVLGWAVPVQRQPALIEVGGRARKRLVWSGIGTALLLGVFGAGWSGAGSGIQGPGWSEVAQGARALLGYGLVTFVTAGVTGLLLGASSANGPRSLDAALVRTVEVAGALPAVLWAAAVGQTLGSGVVFAVVLGGIRGLDVAWTLRAELLRRAHHDDELGLRSLGHYPLSAYYRHRLRPAVLPALCTLFVTPAWWVAIGAVAHLLGPRAIPGKLGWDVLLAGTESGAASLGAAALIALVTWVLLGFVTAAPRRVGALRSSIPPPLHTRA